MVYPKGYCPTGLSAFLGDVYRHALSEAPAYFCTSREASPMVYPNGVYPTYASIGFNPIVEQFPVLCGTADCYRSLRAVTAVG
jgi:hypothetical protein